MTIVDRRIRNRYGEAYGVSIACDPDVFTRVTLRLPLPAEETVPA
ncbi:hypothetical protein [Azospirillum sp. INR13]|nr:hypothetical protein [Azospirillum sp. INR13]